MGTKYKSLGHEMQKVIDLGLIDHWLRGLHDLVPRRASANDPDGFNTHLIAYDCIDSIEPAHIQNLTGCRQLLAGCSRHDVGIDIHLLPDGHLCVAFQPERQFRNSTVFGASYHNVLPTLFGASPARSR